MVPEVTTMLPFLSEIPALPGAFAASGAALQPSSPAGLDFAGLLDAAALPPPPAAAVPALNEPEPAVLPFVSPRAVTGQVQAAADMAGGRNLPEPGTRLPLVQPVSTLPHTAPPIAATSPAPMPAPVSAFAPTAPPAADLPEPLATPVAIASADPVADDRPARTVAKADAADHMPYPPPAPVAPPAPVSASAEPAAPGDEALPPVNQERPGEGPIVAMPLEPLPAAAALPQPGSATVAFIQPPAVPAAAPELPAPARTLRAAGVAPMRGARPAGTAPDTASPASEPAPSLPLASATGLETAPSASPTPAATAASPTLSAAQPEPAPPPVLANLAPAPQTPAAPDRAGEPRAPAPQVEAAIEQVGSLREAMRSARPEMTVRHAEFGFVSVRLEQAAPDNWRAVLASRDPGFVPAIQAALEERSVMATSESASFSGQSGASQNGTSDQRYGASPNGGQGSSQPYMGQSGSRDGEAAPDHRHPSTSAAIAGRTDAEEEASGSSAASSGGLFA